MPIPAPSSASPASGHSPVPATSAGSGASSGRCDPADPLRGLLHHEQIWRARQLEPARPVSGGAPGTAERVVPSGFEALDHALGGGWPTAGLTELLHDQRGIGEMRLLLPALAHLSRETPAWIALIGPPHMPCADALAAAGVDIDRILLVHAADHADVLWATEQALRSGTCSAVLAWPDSARVRAPDLRRLQIAARASSTWCVLARDERAADQASMASLRLRLAPSADEQLAIEVLKCRGVWPGRPFTVALPSVLSPWSARRAASGIAPTETVSGPRCRQQNRQQSRQQSRQQQMSSSQPQAPLAESRGREPRPSLASGTGPTGHGVRRPRSAVLQPVSSGVGGTGVQLGFDDCLPVLAARRRTRGRRHERSLGRPAGGPR